MAATIGTTSKSVVLPLSKAIMAVMTLHYAVGHWNNYFSALIYLNTDALCPLQVFLRRILVLNEVEADMMNLQNIADLGRDETAHGAYEVCTDNRCRRCRC